MARAKRRQRLGRSLSSWAAEHTGYYTRKLFLALVSLTFILAFIYYVFEVVLQPLGPGEAARPSYLRTLMDIFILLLSGFDVDKKPVTVVGWITAFLVLITNILFIGTIIQSIGEIILKAKGRRLSGMAGTKFKGHTIIFGLTQCTRAVIDLYLRNRNKYRTRIVLVDNRLETLPLVYAAETEWIDFVRGDPFDEAVLDRAGVRDAASAIVCPPDDVPAAQADSHAILIALAVERMCPEVITSLILRNRTSRRFLVANTNNGRIRLNVDQVICPDEIIENLTANAALNPGLAAFLLDVISYAEDAGEDQSDDSIIVVQALPDDLLPDAGWREREVSFRELVDAFLGREGALLLGLQEEQRQRVLPGERVRVGSAKGLVLRKERRQPAAPVRTEGVAKGPAPG